MPEKMARRTPFALPHPCQIVYVIDVESPSIQQMKVSDPRSYLSNQFVQFSRNDKAGNGYFLMNLSLATSADFVPADQVEKHRELVEQIWRASSRELSIQKGYSRPRQKHGFGEIPLPPRKTEIPQPATKAIPRNTQENRSSSPPLSRKSHHPVHDYQNKIPRWLIIVGIIFVSFWIVVMFILLNPNSEVER